MIAQVRQPMDRSALVLDGDNQSTLAIVRSLGRNGVRVEVGATTPRAIAGLSRFCSGVFLYPDPMSNPGGFQKSIVEHLQTHRYSIVIPVTDVTICPLMEIRKPIEEHSALGIASNESLEVVLSKSRTYDTASALGIPIPRTFAVKEVKELDHIGAVLGTVGYPVVVKPDRSKVWGPDGECRSLSVSYARSQGELYGRVCPLLAFGPVILQEHVTGQGVGIGILASNGKVVMQCQYRRLHEVPLTGGGSSYRVTEAIDPILAEWVSLLAKRLRWHGVAMVEFKNDRDQGKAWLMEINGRFWGALPLAVAAGADFPRYLFEHMVDNKHVFQNGYRVGLRCRNLAKEAIWLREAIGSRKAKNELVMLPSYSQIFLGCCRIMNPKERSDMLELRDPWPGLIDLWRIARQTLNDLRNRLRLLKEIALAWWIKVNPGPVISQLRGANCILVICSGNVIRSPFAAALLANLISQHSVRVASAGLDTRPGRPADPRAVMKAKQFGVDLTCHTSTPVTPELVEEAEVIFAMEVWQILELKNRFDQARRKTFLLTSLSPLASRDIPDPMFKGDAAFAACFNQILHAVRSFSVSASSDSRSSRKKGSSESQSMERLAQGNPSSIKRFVKRAVLGFKLSRSVLSWLARRHCPIFMYHRFGENFDHGVVSRDAWSTQLDELKRSVQVLTLGEFCRQRMEGRRDWRGTCVLTVDDGYRDFYEVAYPELKKRNLPATLFVATGVLHPGIWLWWDAIRYMIDRTALTSATIAFSGGTLHLDLTTEEAKHNSWARVGTVCSQVSTKQKREIVRRLIKQLNVSVPDHPPENYQGCSVAELNSMAEHGITFGSHTVTHPILTRCDPQEWQNEIIESHDHLVSLSKGYVKIFAFPNGTRGDYSEAIVQFLEKQGFESAVVGHYDEFQHETPFTLRRCVGSSDFVDFQWKLLGGEYVWERINELMKAVCWGRQ